MTAQPQLPKMSPLASSHLESAGHDPITKTLAISFKDGSLYAYSGVQPGTYIALAASKSPGGFFNSNIKGRFQAAKLKSAAAKAPLSNV